MAQSYHHGDLHAALLAAAEAELAERGVEGFSLRGVARRAGVSHAAPAHHFGDVNGLLTALAAVSFARFRDAMEAAAAAAGPDPLSQLVGIGIGYIEYAASSPQMFGLQFGSGRPDRTDPELRRRADASLASLTDRVDVLARAVGSDPADEADIAPTFWATAHGLATLFAIRQSKAFPTTDPEERRARFERILRTVAETARMNSPVVRS